MSDRHPDLAGTSIELPPLRNGDQRKRSLNVWHQHNGLACVRFYIGDASLWTLQLDPPRTAALVAALQKERAP